MFLVQINDRDGVLKELLWAGEDREKSEHVFIGIIGECLTDPDGNPFDYTTEDIKKFLDDGYAKFEGGAVNFIDTSKIDVVEDEGEDDYVVHKRRFGIIEKCYRVSCGIESGLLLTSHDIEEVTCPQCIDEEHRNPPQDAPYI